MAFTVETGLGLTDSNSYVSVADADSYHADRNNTAWTAQGTTTKQAALIKATDFIDAAYRFIGVRWNEDQALEWPRDLLDDDLNDDSSLDAVPTRVKKATYELALIALDQDLFKNPDSDKPGGAIVSQSSKVGPIEEDIEYIPTSGVWRYPAIHRILRPVLYGQTSLLRV